MTPVSYTVETGQSGDGRRFCRLVGPGGALRWVPDVQQDALVRYAEQCNRVVTDGGDPAACRPGGAS